MKKNPGLGGVNIFKKSLFYYLTLFLIILVTIIFTIGCEKEDTEEENENSESISLLDIEDEIDLEVYLKGAIEDRRSIRSYEEGEIKLKELTAILWSAQGITDEDNQFRATPSAGATYPMEVYVAVGNVEELDKGIYRYLPLEHELVKVLEGDPSEELMTAALNQEPIGEASMNLIITSVYERVMGTYGERGIRYAKMEAGHISQNIFLKCTALNLGTVSIGAFDDQEIAEIMNLDEGEEPLYIMPVGRR